MPQILSLVGLSSLPLEILKKESEDDSVQLLDLHSLVETQHNATANSTTTTTTTTSTTPTTSTTSSEADNSTKKELGESNKVEKVAEKEIIENEEREKTNTINIDNRVVEQPSISKNVDNE